jgi:hypothetical protein
MTRQITFNVITKRPDWNFVAHQTVTAPSRKKATAQVLEKDPTLISVATVPQSAYDKQCDKYNGGFPPLDEVKKL